MEDLVELFERQVNYVLRQEGTKVFLALPRFVAFVTSEPRIAAVVDDFASEYRAECLEYERTDDALVIEFEQFWQMNVQWFTRQWDGALEVGKVALVKEKSGHPSDVAGLISTKRKKSSRGLSHEIESSRLAEVFSRVDLMVYCFETPDPSEQQRKFQFRRDYMNIGGCSDFARRRREAIENTHPGAAWRRLSWAADQVCPQDDETPIGAPNEGDDDEDALRVSLEGLQLSDAALGRDPVVPNAALIDPRPGIIGEDLEIIREEVVRRIGLHLSHRALLTRFKAKCERFLAAELRTKCAQKTSSVEAVLTLAAAEYLFDQGLNPLFNPQIVNLRPDLFDSALPHALYVEAKQYKDGQSPIMLVKKAAWQVWDTWNELDAQHRVTEAFLVVFRRGGPLVVFEGPARFHGRTLHPILVDIGLTSGKGSRQKDQPVQVAAADLLPRAGDNRTRRTVKRRGRKKVG